MQTKEQQRSEFALKQVKEVFQIPVDEKVANFVVGVPTMILTNGLGQTLAFLLSKYKEPEAKDSEKKKKDKLKYRDAFDIIQRWINRQENTGLTEPNRFQFLQQLSALDQKTYLRAQQEALALLQWLKRYARAFQEDTKPEDQKS